MSTHIGPAFKLARDTDVFTFAENLRVVTEPALKRFLFQHVHSMAITTYDYATTFKPFAEVIKDEMADYCWCRTSERSWVTSAVADATAYIYRDENENLFLLIQGAPHEVADAVAAMDEVEGDYSYHDSSDSQLAEITYEQWKERLAKWNSLIPKNGYAPIYTAGISIKLGLEPALLKLEDYEEFADSLISDSEEQREARILENVYMRLWLGTAKDEDDRTTKFNTMVSTMMGSNRELPDAEEQPELLAQAQTEAAKIWEERRNLA